MAQFPPGCHSVQDDTAVNLILLALNFNQLKNEDCIFSTKWTVWPDWNGPRVIPRVGINCSLFFLRARIIFSVSWGGSFSISWSVESAAGRVHDSRLKAKPNLSQLYLSQISLAKPAKLNFFKTPASVRCQSNYPSPCPEPVFVNVYGAQESIPRNRFRQPM
jgi:hypothetical protein